MRKVRSLIMVLALVPCLGVMSGCNKAQAAQKTQQVLVGIFNIASDALPGFQATGVFTPNDYAIAQGFVALGQSLSAQLGTCVTNAVSAGSKNAAFLSCFNIFVQGLLSPTELTQMRIMSVIAQQRVTVWVTAVALAVNAILTVIGGNPIATPVNVGAATTPAVADLNLDLNQLRDELIARGYDLGGVQWAAAQ